LHDRCITRDLSWGVPVPRPGFERKVFYVWFDAPIGYIAAAVDWAAAAPGRDWRAWWEGGDQVRHLQFLAKDNVPFHAISFPATLLGSGLPLKLADTIKGFNWLTFEGGKFSTSSRRGIFADRALAALPADTWRWWLAAYAPEGADSDFTTARFVAGVNKDLADTFGNLVHRCLSFVTGRYGGIVPSAGAAGPAEAVLACRLTECLRRLRDHHEALEFRKTAEQVRAVWRLGKPTLRRKRHGRRSSAIPGVPPLSREPA
jgi:methionyl-tRNA synthetase